MDKVLIAFVAAALAVFVLGASLMVWGDRWKTESCATAGMEYRSESRGRGFCVNAAGQMFVIPEGR